MRKSGWSASQQTTLLQLVYMALEAPEEGIPWEFVLNTVDNVRTENDTVWIGGECSPFVRTRQ